MSFAQAGQIIYDDARQNGWEDWGWATLDYTSTTTVHSGARSVSVTAGANQAIYLHHAAFDTSVFSDLTFWIHGGTTGGQRLLIQALLNDVAQPQVNLPLLTNGWQQISLSLASLGVAAKPNLTGFWLQNRDNFSIPTFYVDDIQLLSAPVPATVNVSVNAAQIVRTVDGRFFGLNAAIWDAVFDTTNTIGLLKELDNRVLRFPGGSLSDEYHWATGTTGANTWTWVTAFSNFVHVATNTGAQVFITANYGSGTPAEAAAWVRHANVTNQLGFKYWEVGNENYGSWETDTNNRPHDPYTYGTRFQNYVTQMKAVDPSIKVGAVIAEGEDGYATYTDHPATNSRTLAVHHGWTPVLLTRLKQLNITPDFVIYHRYEQSPGAESDSGLLQSAKTWTNDVAGLRQQLTDYLGASATNVEIIVTENNSVSYDPGKQTTSLINGLFLADSVGQVLQTEINALVWWALRNGPVATNNNSPSLYGWRPYGDYGITDGSNPSSATNRYPAFHVAKLLKYFARGGDRVVRASSDYSGLAVYATRRTNGFLTVLAINKTSTNALNANLSLAGYPAVSNAVVFSYGIPQDEAARTGIGSAEVWRTNAPVAGTNFNYTFPPYSVTLLALTSEPVVNVVPKSMEAGGSFHLQIRGLPDVRYALQTSSNLGGWLGLATNALSAEMIDWLEVGATNQTRAFYRALWLP